MKKFDGLVKSVSRVFDIVAGAGIVAMMLLVVSNILLREIFKKPILGTYEYVGFFTTIVIGLALSYCAMQDGHIAIELFFDKMSEGSKKIVSIITNTISFIFFGFISWNVLVYANRMVHTGEVSPTTQTPFYPFIYIAAVGLFLLAIAIFTKVFKLLREEPKR